MEIKNKSGIFNQINKCISALNNIIPDLSKNFTLNE